MTIILPEINRKYCVTVCEGKISFWFDRWLTSELLATNGHAQNPKLLLKDVGILLVCMLIRDHRVG